VRVVSDVIAAHSGGNVPVRGLCVLLAEVTFQYPGSYKTSASRLDSVLHEAGSVPVRLLCDWIKVRAVRALHAGGRGPVRRPYLGASNSSGIVVKRLRAHNM
jgi:hypothetical protein